MNKIFLLLFVSASFLMTSCEDMLDVDSKKKVFGDENEMKSDDLYSIFGILHELQNLVDSYVILGELRGDLLESRTDVNKFLDEINLFDNYSKDNPYTNNKGDYYAVINNCNYVIHNLDTAKVTQGEKTLYSAMAAAKGIRAWTYMQLALNYEEVYYFDKPLLSIGEGMKEQKPIKKEDLFPMLITDILPFKHVPPIYKGSWGGFIWPELLCISIPFTLGDLYLWTGQYENAANEYRDLMFNGMAGYGYAYTTAQRSTYEISNAIVGPNTVFTGRWYSPAFIAGKSYYEEYISVMAASNEFERKTSINDMFYLNNGNTLADRYPVLLPTTKALDNFDKALYFENYFLDGQNVKSLTTYGDIRKNQTFLSFNFSMGESRDTITYVGKYLNMNGVPPQYAREPNIIVLYRVGMLYLRYAEAVNRLNKPNLAMAVLKHGLKSATIANRDIIPANEAPEMLPNYMNFNDTRFDDNLGVRARGLGYTERDTTFYIIKLDGIINPTLNDSVLFVENLIQEELALESAYEGNRFHDLMRIAMRRDDNAYLANIVASKFQDEGTKQVVKQKLTANREKWYIK